MRPLEIDTPHGPAHVHLLPVADPEAALVLGHGAGGGIAAPDLTAAANAANVAGGRSAGARVACRTAAATGAAAVLCLAFPLQPPPRAGRPPGPSRIAELEAVAVPVLAVQGSRDRFGTPPAAPGRTVVRVEGDHSLRADLEAVGAAVASWLKPALARPRPG